MKILSKLFEFTIYLFFLVILYFVANAYGFSKFFLLIGGLFIGGLIFLLFILPLFTKIDSYYERNKEKKYRFVLVIIFAVIGILSGLLFMVLKNNGLFPNQENDFGYTIMVFCFLGFVTGFIFSRFINLKEKKYYF